MEIKVDMLRDSLVVEIFFTWYIRLAIINYQWVLSIAKCHIPPNDRNIIDYSEILCIIERYNEKNFFIWHDSN